MATLWACSCFYDNSSITWVKENFQRMFGFPHTHTHKCVYLFLLFPIRWENEFAKNNFRYIINEKFRNLAMTFPLSLQKRISKNFVTFTVSNHQNTVKNDFKIKAKHSNFKDRERAQGWKSMVLIISPPLEGCKNSGKQDLDLKWT